MPFKEDFDGFIQLSDFAEAFTWNALTINGIFDNETYRVEGETAVPVDIQRPVVGMTSEDAQAMSIGDTIDRVDPARSYQIVGFAPDGTGMTLVALANA